MTDDSNARYRLSDPFAPNPNAGGQVSDPLAELARLIGQSEQFPDISRDPRAAPAPREPQYYDDPPPQEFHAERERPDYDPRYDAPYAAPAEPAPYAADHAHDHVQDRAHDHHHDHAHDPAQPAQSAAPDIDWKKQPPFDPFASGSGQHASMPQAADRYQEAPPQQRTGEPEFDFRPLHAASARQPGGSFNPPPMGAPLRNDPGSMPDPVLHSDRGPTPPPLDEYYDDAPQGGRRKGLLTVAAVFLLAVLGTGAAFGYRTWFSGPSIKGPPAVIRASAEPTKVAPPPPSAADPNANKISYDRFSDRGQNEKVVLREEKPVDIREATRTGAMVTGTPSIANQPSAAAVPNGANPPSVLTDPKRVRTVPIRPDAPDAAAVTRPAMVTPPAAQPARQVAAATSSSTPLDMANSPPPQARAAAPAPRSSPPPAVRPAPAPPSTNVPLSLAPEANNAPPPAAAPARSPAPTRVASAPAAGNGNYLVQVSSQRSEADAQAAFRSVKSKHSNVLGEYQPVIRRADLAGKGTYYRAMVGPFTTRDQAVQLCSSLKASGGDCVVQAN